MKQQISDIIIESTYTSFEGISIAGIDVATERIEQLMCYREVHSFVFGYNFSGRKVQWEFVFAIFIETYPKESVMKAIEQVKNELK